MFQILFVLSPVLYRKPDLKCPFQSRPFNFYAAALVFQRFLKSYCHVRHAKLLKSACVTIVTKAKICGKTSRQAA